MTARGLMILIFLIPVTALLSAGCSNSGTTNTSTMFTVDVTNPPENSFFLGQESVTDDTIDIALLSSTMLIDRVYGLAFDLVYDPQVLSFMATKPGTWLEDNGIVTVNYLAAPQSSDSTHLVVGISQQGNVAGVIGPGRVAVFQFRILHEGTTRLDFATTTVKNPQLETVSGITWIGGSLRIER